MEELDESVPVAEELLACKVCGRNFFPKVLKKHMLICQKAAAKKRRVFDSSRQRAEGTDISSVKPIKPKPEPPKKLSNWRRKHEDFIATIRAAKGLNQVMKDGGPLPPPPPPSYDPDYIQCPYCQRRFSENAADRHIKFCKEQASRISNKGKFSGSEKAKPVAKTQYKPAPAKKASPAPSTSSVSSSRLPQRPAYGQGGGTGMSGTKSPVGSVKNVAASGSFSPPRPNTGGVTSPPSGVNTKPKGVVAPSSLKSTTYGGGMSKKKTYTTNSLNSRNDVKNDSDVDYSAQGTKFCHECGTKYPVDWAKFCCECGVKRMCI